MQPDFTPKLNPPSSLYFQNLHTAWWTGSKATCKFWNYKNKREGHSSHTKFQLILKTLDRLNIKGSQCIIRWSTLSKLLYHLFMYIILFFWVLHRNLAAVCSTVALRSLIPTDWITMVRFFVSDPLLKKSLLS